MEKNRKFSYKKVSAEKELWAEDLRKSTVQHKPYENIDVLPLPGYTKEDGILPYSIFCVISGGTVRERDFLTELEAKKSFSNLRVIFVSSPKGEGGLTPRMMSEKLSEILKDGYICPDKTSRKVEIDSMDSFYLLTDVDHYEDEIRQIITFQNFQNNVKWIISNPAFEIWLYYCFFSSPEEELMKPLMLCPVERRSSELKRLLGNMNNGGGIDPRKAFKELKVGITNSKMHYKEEKGIPLFLSTQMHVLAEDILDVLGCEYSAFLQKEKVWRARMK